MDSKAVSTRVYQDYVPDTEVVQEEDCETLLLSLPGFRKDQLKVQLTPTPTLKISGERPVGGNKWIRFQKEYSISSNCDKNKITARFEDGILYIRQPKLNTLAIKSDEEKPVNEAQKLKKNETEPQPTLPQPSEMEKKEEDKFHDADEGDQTQNCRDNKDSREGIFENDEQLKRKGVDEYEKGELVTSRVKMVKKIGRMMSIVVVVLSAVVIGIFFKNLIAPATSSEN